MSLDSPEHPRAGAHSGPGVLTDDELIDAVAARVVRMGLSVPAVFFLESVKPLSFVGSQALVFFEPFVKAVLTVQSYHRFVALMEDRENIEKLILRIEDADHVRDREEKAQKEEKARERIRAREQDGARQGRKPREESSFRNRLARFFGRR